MKHMREQLSSCVRGLLFNLLRRKLFYRLFISIFFTNFPKGISLEKVHQDVKKWDLNTHGYTLTLNGAKPTLLEELRENDPRRALIPVQNNWNKYYFIRFDSVPEGALTLLLENNQTGSVALSYQKGK